MASGSQAVGACILFLFGDCLEALAVRAVNLDSPRMTSGRRASTECEEGQTALCTHQVSNPASQNLLLSRHEVDIWEIRKW